MNTLAKYWAAGDVSKRPYVHTEDRPFFKRHRPQDLSHTVLNANTFLRDERARDPHFFHLSLLPVPYIGELDTADVFVLMLNPGFQDREYEVEKLPGVEDALRSTLNQSRTSAEYPFWYLDPAYNDHPGHPYWKKKLKGVGDYQELSKRLAVLQMMPYHSAKYNADKLTQELPSARVARNYVQEVVVPKAIAGEVLLIVARQVRNWGFVAEDPPENVIVYSRGQNVGAQVSSGSRGGKAIIRWLSQEPTHKQSPAAV